MKAKTGQYFKKISEKLIIKFADFQGIDLLTLAMNRQGILNYSNSFISGETYLIENFLKEYFKKRRIEKPVFFDVGANIGKYTQALLQSFADNCNIYAFEPNPNSYKYFQESFKDVVNDSVHIFPLGFSSSTGAKLMATYENNLSSSHTSLYSEVFDEFHKSDKKTFVNADFTTLDEFCQDNNIGKIHLLKIDTEGHELDILKGASELIKSNKIDLIQFEFGECHVYSRVFLRDFYLHLPNFDFYRLMPDHLKPLGHHTPAYEIFRFQNIIAIRK